eukprot:6280181-Lingulodinium_polyedra.AAC.1
MMHQRLRRPSLGRPMGQMGRLCLGPTFTFAADCIKLIRTGASFGGHLGLARNSGHRHRRP